MTTESLTIPLAPALSVKLRRSYVWVSGGTFLIQGLTWVSTLFVARLLRPEDYGLLGMSAVFISLCRTLQDAGLTPALIRHRDLSEEAIRSAFSFLMVSAGVMLAIGWVGAPLLAAAYQEPRIIPIIRVLSFQFPIIALRSVPSARLIKALDFKRITQAEGTGALFGAATTAGLAWNGWGVWSLVGGSLVMETMQVAMFYWFDPWRPRWRWNGVLLKPLFAFGVPAVGATVLWQVYSQTDFVVVGATLGPDALGFYAMAWQLAMLTNDKVAAVMNRINFPVFSALQSDPRAVGRHWISVSEMVAWVSFPLLVGLMVVSRDVVGVLLTDKWLALVPILQALCVLALLRTVAITMPAVINALGHPKKVLVFNIVCVLVCPPAFMVGAKLYGLAGVAIAWIVVYSMLFAWLTSMTLKLTETRPGDFLLPLLPPLATAVLMGLAVWGLRGFAAWSPLLRLVARIAMGGTVYLACTGFWLSRAGRLSGFLASLRGAKPVPQ